MKIVVDLTSLDDNFSGIEKFALSTTKEMLKDKSNEYVLIFKNKIHDEFLNPGQNVKIKVFKSKHKLWAAQLWLPLYLLGEKADVYFFPAFPAPFLFFNKKSITTIHDMSSWDCPQADKPWMNLYFKILYRKAAKEKKKIVTVSKFSKERISSILNVEKERIKVVYSGISEDLLNFEYNEQLDKEVCEKFCLKDKGYILCLSTIEPRKNMSLLLDAYVRLRKNGKVRKELVLAGRKGWLVDDIMSGIDQESAKHIHFTGFVKNEYLPYIYLHAAYFVFPSIYEGFGLPPVEAMYFKTLVLSSDASSMPEVLKNGAFYFKNNSVDDLMASMIQIGEMSDTKKDVKNQEAHQVIMQYKWERTTKILLDFFNE
ncbi:MAG: glycosyltransferase family 4 protein [Lachnospiraceae bacterium]|jgi:glycosyltransferase involved in cell wall biosynthesis|nr:glycosyltransferase family 4 protein [Lachnospiraceae bacterium]